MLAGTDLDVVITLHTIRVLDCSPLFLTREQGLTVHVLLSLVYVKKLAAKRLNNLLRLVKGESFGEPEVCHSAVSGYRLRDSLLGIAEPHDYFLLFVALFLTNLKLCRFDVLLIDIKLASRRHSFWIFRRQSCCFSFFPLFKS